MPIKPITGVVSTPMTITVQPGQEGEIIFDGDGTNVVRVTRVPFDQSGVVSAPVTDLTTPNKAYDLLPGRYEITVPTFGSNFNLHYQVK